MGARFRHRRQHHADHALPRPASAATSWPTCRSRNSATRRRYTTGRMWRRPALPVIHARDIEAPSRYQPALEQLIAHARTLLQPLGLGAVRPRHPRQYRAAAGRRCRGRARAGRAEGARAHRRRDAALLRRRPARGRQAGGGRSLAQHHRGRRRPLAITDNLNFGNPRAPGDHGPVRRLPRRASRKPAARSISRSCPATSRSTTRPTAAASCRRPRSAASGVLDDFTRSATLAFKAAGEAILLIGETQGWLGQSYICATSAGARRARRRRSISPPRSATATWCAA